MLVPAFLALVTALFSLTPAAAAGTTYFVSPNGSDDGAGGLLDPWLTIQHAVGSSGPGDTIFLRAGTYNEAVHISAGGAPGGMKVLAAYPGEAPVLDGGGAEFAGVTVEQGVSYLRLEGLAFVDYTNIGVALDGGNSHIELDGLDSSGGSGGLRMTWGYSGDAPLFGPVDHVTVSNSDFHDNSLSGIDCTPGPCDDVTFTNVTVRDNGVGAQSFAADGLAVEKGMNITLDRVRSLRNGGDGIDLNSRDGGPVPGILVTRSVSGGNHLNGIKLWSSGRIENSIVYGSGVNPLPLAAFDDVSIELVNNTFAWNMWDPSYAVRDYAMTVGYPEGGIPVTGVTLTMFNNVFAFNTGPSVGSPTGIYLGEGVSLNEGNNLYFSRDDCEIYAEFTGQCYAQADITGGIWTAATGQGAGNLAADPLFADAPAGDFHPAGMSPVLDAGTGVAAPASDHDGRPRPLAGGYDIGAFEGTGAAQPVLGWTLDDIYWDSFSDFLARRLTVAYTLGNSGQGEARTVSLAASSTTGGVRLETALPLPLGDIGPQGALPVTLKYIVPAAVVRFLTVNRVSCTDADGSPVSFPPQ